MAMFQHQDRWRRLFLLCVGLYASDGFKPKAASMPQIERLDLRFTRNCIGPAFMLDLSSAHSMQNLNLESTYASPITGQLTRLKTCSLLYYDPGMEYIVTYACLRFLWVTPKLEMFRLNVRRARFPLPRNRWATCRVLLSHLGILLMFNSRDVTFILE
ncbi:hypothetical protein DFH11DRAFT_1628592 [Phellopilus nigrolimitatus]|nr:hypothetical protein DFH11DRAFT_1628592 [Phellopilus nigrolimitatus]